MTGVRACGVSACAERRPRSCRARAQALLAGQLLQQLAYQALVAGVLARRGKWDAGDVGEAFADPGDDLVVAADGGEGGDDVVVDGARHLVPLALARQLVELRAELA